MAVFTVLACAVALLAAFWIYFSWNFDYWSKQGVPSCNPFSLFGDRGGGLPFTKPFWELLDPVYAKYKGKTPYVGMFQARRPVLVLLDPEITKTVLTKDFSNFQGRGQPIDEEGDPLSANLFNLEGPRWKNLRARLSPTFTSGKLKNMFPLMADTTSELTEVLKKKAANKEEVEMKDLLVRYATDIIGTVAFGITCNSLKGEDSEFHSATRDLFAKNALFLIRFFLTAIHPVFVKLMPFKSLFYKTTNFFIRVMTETVEYREKNNIERNDFVNLMMQMRKEDQQQVDRANHIEFSHNVMTAQAFLFFVAGLDNVANTVGFALHELALQPELQTRAADEVRRIKAKHGGMTYAALKDMVLIEMIIRESLRKWGPISILTREPGTTLKIPGTDVMVDKRCMIWIPVWHTQHDPEFFPEPERFDPERWTEEAKEQRHPYAYLPFGEGPRFCIAERFAILEMTLCLASLLGEYQFSIGQKTDLSLKLDPKVFSPTPKGGFWLRLEERP